MASAVPFPVNQGTIDDVVGRRVPVSESKLKEMDIVKTDSKYAGFPIFKAASGAFMYLMKPLGRNEYVVIQEYQCMT